MLEAGYVRLREVVVKRVTVVPFGVNDGCGNGTSCCAVEVRTDNESAERDNSKIWRGLK